MNGPQFVKYFEPIITALKKLGNSGTPSEVRQLVAETLQLNDEVLNEQLPSGSSRFDNQVAWAKFYLSKAGLIDSSNRGVWSLTEKGITLNFTSEEALTTFQTVQQSFKNKNAVADNLSDIEPEVEEESIPPSDSSPTTSSGFIDYRQELLELLKNLSPGGFEKLCQRLLRESGFQQVEVTGKAGDGGIDGKGILEINPLLSFRVLFQCKRYSNSVGPAQIRDFRGAMMGRADKGIFITTGTFTIEARREAARDGASPIELVDADKLVTMFENLELGLIPKTVYEINKNFFDEFT